MNRQTIYVSAYPKSGSTYLTRLLGDILNSPTGGCISSEDANEIATEGQDRPGSYVVRKGHYVLIDDDSGDVVPRPHRMAYKQLTDEKVVFLVRDPRDICISGAYHWRATPAEFLDRMINGSIARCGRWDEYVSEWIDYNHDICHMVKYEDLLAFSYVELIHIESYIGNGYDRIEQAIERQSFANRSEGLDENEMRRNNMRKGTVGDWRNHFTKEMQNEVWNEFGWIMERLGYDKAF